MSNVEKGIISNPNTDDGFDYLSRPLPKPVTEGQVVSDALKGLVYKHNRQYTTGFAPPDLPPPQEAKAPEK